MLGQLIMQFFKPFTHFKHDPEEDALDQFERLAQASKWKRGSEKYQRHKESLVGLLELEAATGRREEDDGVDTLLDPLTNCTIDDDEDTGIPLAGSPRHAPLSKDAPDDEAAAIGQIALAAARAFLASDRSKTTIEALVNQQYSICPIRKDPRIYRLARAGCYMLCFESEIDKVNANLTVLQMLLLDLGVTFGDIQQVMGDKVQHSLPKNVNSREKASQEIVSTLSNNAAKKILAKIHVNIFDYINCKSRNVQIQPIFRNKAAFREYNLHSKKSKNRLFPRTVAKQSKGLASLLDVLTHS